MKSNEHTAEQIIKILDQAAIGEQSVAAVCREHGIAETTFYRWRKAYGGMTVNEAQRLKELERENGRLKRLLAERVLENDLLRELLEKKAECGRPTRKRCAFLVQRWALGSACLCACCAPSLDVSLRRASTGRYRRCVHQMQALAAQHPRYGYRRIDALLNRTQHVNHKRVRRLWRLHRLQVRRSVRQRRRRPASAPPGSGFPGHIWAYDFVEDALADGSTICILTVMDEFTREGLALDVARTHLGGAGAGGRWRRWLLSTARRAICAATMGRSSWQRRCKSGWRSAAWRRCISSPASRGKMGRRSASTERCATNA